MTCQERYPAEFPDPSRPCDSCGEYHRAINLPAADIEDLRGLLELLAVQLEYAAGTIPKNVARTQVGMISHVHDFHGREGELQALLGRLG